MALNISPATKVKLAGKTAQAKMSVLAPVYWNRYKKVAVPAAAGTAALAISSLIFFWRRSQSY